jgi:hypothetical protein
MKKSGAWNAVPAEPSILEMTGAEIVQLSIDAEKGINFGSKIVIVAQWILLSFTKIAI